MEGLITLCTEVCSDAENTDVQLTSDVLQGLLNHKVFKSVQDDLLKKYVKTMNGLLNIPKTRPVGLILLKTFVVGVEHKQLVGILDNFVSSIQLLGKCFDSELAHNIVVDLLPICQKIPELSQAAVASVIPKALGKFCDSAKFELPSHEEFRSAVACLEKYKGQSSSFRNQLEKALVALIDKDMDVFTRKQYGYMWTLLSSTGGGGNKGEKHTECWEKMVQALMKDCYDCLMYLFADVCSLIDNNNPLGADAVGMGLGRMEGARKNSSVFHRISHAVKRACALAGVIGSHLSTPFPAPKVVPMRALVDLISTILATNSVSLLKTDGAAPSIELSYLSCLLPKLMMEGIKLATCLLTSVETDIFPELPRLEFLLIQQLTWINESRGDFKVLKLEVFDILSQLLRITNSSLSTNQNSELLAKLLLSDVSIERASVAISLDPKRRKSSKANGRLSLTPIEVSPEAILRDAVVTSGALKVLQLLIPSIPASWFKTVYQTLTKTVSDFQRSPEPPSPYNTAESRKEALKCLATIAENPNHQAPVSIALIITFLEKGCKDSYVPVSSCCVTLLQSIERIIHPTRATMEFAAVPVVHSAEVTSVVQEKSFEDVEMDESHDEIDSRRFTSDKDLNLTVSTAKSNHVPLVEPQQPQVVPSPIVSVDHGMNLSVIRDVISSVVKEHLNIDELVARIQESSNVFPSRKRARYDSEASDATVTKEEMAKMLRKEKVNGTLRANEQNRSNASDYQKYDDEADETRITLNGEEGDSSDQAPASPGSQSIVESEPDREVQLQLTVHDLVVDFDDEMIV